jgi:hypothetical protein
VPRSGQVRFPVLAIKYSSNVIWSDARIAPCGGDGQAHLVFRGMSCACVQASDAGYFVAGGFVEACAVGSQLKADFQLTIETILRYLEYNMSFKTFLIFCDSAPYTFYDELYEKDNFVETMRKSIIDGSKKYLSHLCSSLFKFLKQLSYHYQGLQNFDMEALEDLFPENPISQKTIFLETLNKPEVLESIFSATREEELLLNISTKSFRKYKFQQIENLSDNVINNSDKTPDWILSDENIKTIVSNLSDFGVAERKLSAVRSLLKDYISDENPLRFANHRYPTRSKDGGALLGSYFGQASTTVTGNKGSRKRAISDEEISSSSSKQI